MNKPKTVYVTAVKVGRILAGTLVTKYGGYDYGLARDDTEYTGIKHISVSVFDDEYKDDKTPLSFTIQERHLIDIGDESVPLGMLYERVKSYDIDPDEEAPIQEEIEGKPVRYYEEVLKAVVGEGGTVCCGEYFYHTSTIEKIEGDKIFTKNSVYVRMN